MGGGAGAVAGAGAAGAAGEEHETAKEPDEACPQKEQMEKGNMRLQKDLVAGGHEEGGLGRYYLQCQGSSRVQVF